MNSLKTGTKSAVAFTRKQSAKGFSVGRGGGKAGGKFKEGQSLSFEVPAAGSWPWSARIAGRADILADPQDLLRKATAKTLTRPDPETNQQVRAPGQRLPAAAGFAACEARPRHCNDRGWAGADPQRFLQTPKSDASQGSAGG